MSLLLRMELNHTLDRSFLSVLMLAFVDVAVLLDTIVTPQSVQLPCISYALEF